jgi:hypothetical protein
LVATSPTQNGLRNQPQHHPLASAHERRVNHRVVRHGRRTIFRLWLCGLALAAAAHARDETRDAWIRGVFTGNSPRPQIVAESDAWQRAEQIVRATPDAFTLVGGGVSMQPLYPPGTILVLREIEFAALRSGQTAVYRNGARRPVAHVLVAKCRDGWRVRGLNNATFDPEAVVAENLLGIVIAAFVPMPPAATTGRLAVR